jgi:hypothetical protein
MQNARIFLYMSEDQAQPEYNGLQIGLRLGQTFLELGTELNV